MCPLFPISFAEKSEYRADQTRLCACALHLSIVVLCTPTLLVGKLIDNYCSRQESWKILATVYTFLVPMGSTVDFCDYAGTIVITSAMQGVNCVASLSD